MFLSYSVSAEDVAIGVQAQAVDVDAEGQTESPRGGVPDVVASEVPEPHEAVGAKLHGVTVGRGPTHQLDKRTEATWVQECRCPYFETVRERRRS